MKWSVEPYTDLDTSLSYIPSQMLDDPGPLTINSTNNIFLSKLVHFERIDEDFANLTTSLTVRTARVRNGTNVTCTTIAINKTCVINATMYFSGTTK